MHISQKSSNFAAESCKANKIRRKTMARPIAETPILFGEDAERFLYNMQHVRSASQDKKDRVKKAYEWMKSIATFPM